MHQPTEIDDQGQLVSGRGKAQLSQSSGRIDKLNKMARLIQADEHSLLHHGIGFGRELCQYKREVGHGNWQPLFKDGVFDFHVRTAQRYMRLYRRYKELKHDEQGPKQLTVTMALEVLAEPVRGPEMTSENSDDGTENQQPSRADTKPSASSQASKASNQVPAAVNHDEWLTPDYIVGPLIELFGEIDLDPASNADKHVPAKVHLTLAEDGLRPEHHWHGKVFLNPPRQEALAGRFVCRLLGEHEKGNVTEAVALLEAKTDMTWFRQLRPHIRAFLARPEFVSYPGVPDALVAVYLGPRVKRFFDLFGAIGDIYTLYRPVELDEPDRKSLAGPANS